jgi:hypothetical protein
LSEGEFASLRFTPRRAFVDELMGATPMLLFPHGNLHAGALIGGSPFSRREAN